jgi:hypothetical protein
MRTSASEPLAAAHASDVRPNLSVGLAPVALTLHQIRHLLGLFDLLRSKKVGRLGPPSISTILSTALKITL